MSYVDIILVGGPPGITETTRRQRSLLTDHKIKIPHRDGYEHFELDHTASTEDSALLVFRWTMRTKIAE